MPSPLAARRLTNRVVPSDTPNLSSLTGLAVGVVIVAALSLAREVLIPITLAVLLSFMLGPVVAFLRRIGLPRSVSVVLAVIAALGVVSLLGLAIGVQVALLSDSLPRYAATVQHKIDAVREMVTHQLAAVTSGFNNMGGEAAPKPAASNTPAPMPVEVHQPSPAPLDVAMNILMPVLSPLGTAAIVFVVAIFILMQREDLRDRIIRLFGSNDLHRTTAALDDAGARLGRYYLSLLAVNTGFGATIGVGLFFIGVPSPILWGIVAGLFRFVPYVGAFCGALFPIAVAAAVDPGWTMAFETAGLFLLVEPLLGQVVEPMIYGHSTGLSPISVVIAAIFWGWIWGGIGLLLSMPLTLCLVVLGKHIERLEFLDVLLGDQPALSPAESLYQRMLVGDADEALDQAEMLLKTKKLAEYYDEVALPALRLAANDSLREVLTPEQLQGITDTICGVVTELGEAEGAGAPSRPGTVLCIAGRGTLDEAACVILEQRLGAAGVAARVVPPAAVSRGAIGALDLTDVTMVCVSYLEGTDSLSTLRYLVRRLRARVDGIPIVAGLWTMGAPVLVEERVRAAIGADLYAATLQEAIELCTGGMKEGAPVLPVCNGV